MEKPIEPTEQHPVVNQLQELAGQVRENPTARDKIAEAIEVIALTVGRILDTEENIFKAIATLMGDCEDCAAKAQAAIDANGGPL